jgi:hypothetical protein
MQLVIVKLLDRQDEAVRFQKVLTRHGCDIALRLGLHESGDRCSNQGVIILQMGPDRKAAARLVADLKRVGPKGRITVRTVSI